MPYTLEDAQLHLDDEQIIDYDLVCLSHLRWDGVYQRPQHLLSRGAKEHRVFFIEEPIFDKGPIQMRVRQQQDGLWVVVPSLPRGLSEQQVNMLLAHLIDDLFTEYTIDPYVLWYYTPLAITFTGHLEPLVVIYDCMDELSAFKGASTTMRQCEAELLIYADLVFTGGHSLYQAKRQNHRNVYAFPSSVDAEHFRAAREPIEDPPDQAIKPHPRLGFYGVIDERMDLDLLAAIADARPDWQLVMVGPVVKIEQEDLPRRKNLHYLGAKSYAELPAYLSGWDVAIMPFARNASTRFISPTKTLEYMAGGRPIVSTSIRDVVHPYGQEELVYIADTVDDFVEAAQKAMQDRDPMRQQRVDSFLAQTSWDTTWRDMKCLINELVTSRLDWPTYSVVSSPFAMSTEPVDTFFAREGQV